ENLVVVRVKMASNLNEKPYPLQANQPANDCNTLISKTKTPRLASGRFLAPTGLRNQRLEYWGRLRALCRPTFLRSTSRASRVRKPARRREERRFSSYWSRA